MARTTKSNDEVKIGENIVELAGIVKRVIVNNDKVLKFVLDIAEKTKNDKVAHTFMSCVCFDEGTVEVGQFVHVSGKLMTSKYNGEYRVDVLVNDIEVK